MPGALTPQEAAARLEPTDTLGIPLGTGQPPAFMAALGERDDWADLRIYGALLLAWSEAFRHPHVHYLSGLLRAGRARAARRRARTSASRPADFRRFEPLLEQQAPRVMATVAAPPDDDGWCSLSLHAGGTVKELRRAGADPERLLVVETSPRFPRTLGLRPDYPHAIHVDEIDVLVSSEAEPFALPEPEPGEVDAAIAEHARRFIADGSTLQTGIGTIPSAIVGRLAEGDGGDYGVHSEMFTNGLMRLHEAGKVSNRKGQFDGVSVATFAGGSPELYAWLDGQRGGRVPAGRGRQLTGPDRAQPDDGDDQRARSPSTSTARWSPTRSPAASTRASAGTRTSSPARRSRSRTARCSACPRR